MVGNLKTFGFGNAVLPVFNFCVKKLLNPPAIQANQVVMVLAFIEFEHRFAALKMAAAQNTGLFKLGQHPINRSQTHVGAVLQQHTENVFGRHVALATFLEDVQNLQPRHGGFEAGIFEFVDGVHAIFQRCATICRPQANRYNAPMISLYSRASKVRLRVARWASVAAASVLMACGTTDNVSNRLASIISPYRMDIVQGNFVSKEQAAALRAGMSRLQVRDLLGTPLLVSMFHSDRWDYAFTFKRQGVEPQSRKVTVFFKSDVVDRFEADNLPTEAEFVASLDSGRRIGNVPVLEASEESLAKFGASKPAPAALTPSPVLPPLPERYPPLESPTR